MIDGVKCIDGAFLRLGALDVGLFMAPNQPSGLESLASLQIVPRQRLGGRAGL